MNTRIAYSSLIITVIITLTLINILNNEPTNKSYANLSSITELKTPPVDTWKNTYHYGIINGGKAAAINYNSNYPVITQSNTK